MAGGGLLRIRAAVLWSLGWSGGCLDAQPPAKEAATIAELAAELPPVAAKSPAESLVELQLREGFQAQIVAAEPLLRDPVAAAFDESGRMFVLALPHYNGYAGEPAPEGSGEVRLLEDLDDDGQYDRSTIYAADIGYPTGLACWDGGLFVGSAPDLLYLKDTDEDGVADRRSVVLTGFGTDVAGEGQLNSFRWGFDNRIHISTGLDGGKVRLPSQAEEDGREVRGRGILLDPRDPAGFELTSGGGQYGMSMDDWGRKFVCQNSVPAQMLMYDDRYLARNPHMRGPAAAVDIAPEGKFTKLFRISPPEPWRELRTRLRSTGRFRGSDEGGAAFGFFTGATGITIYRGDAWPAEFRGNLLVGDVANNLVYRATVEQAAIGVVARRADDGRDFAASRDIWFRPVQFENAPDGTLYLIDMYRSLIEGAAFLPREFLTVIDLLGGNQLGRIFRIQPANFTRRATPRLGEYPTDQLVALLEHSNGWHRDTASRLLYERQDASAVPLLREMVSGGSSAVGRMTALYALSGLGQLDAESLLAALDDERPLVRVHALRQAEALAGRYPAVAAKICELAADRDSRVRYQVAFSLGALEGPAREQALQRIVLRDGGDRWFRLAAQSSLARGAANVLPGLLSDATFRGTAHGVRFLRALAEQIGRAGPQRDAAATAAELERLSDRDRELAAAITESLLSPLSAAAREQTLADHPKLVGLLSQRLDRAKTVAVDETAASAKRAAAVRQLRFASYPDVEGICRELLALRQPLEVQSAVLDLLVGYRDAAVATVILEAWPTLSPTLRGQAAETLLARPRWILALLDAIESGVVGRGDIELSRIELLKQHQDTAIAARVRQIFAGTALPQRQEVVERFQASLSEAGNAAAGREVFRRVCATCHLLEGIGTSVGADLRGIGARGRPAILLNILDPNREVKPKFLTYIAETSAGRIMTGMIESESANSLQFRQPDGSSVTLLRSDIEQLRSSGISFMPEGLEKQLDVKSMADLLAYLLEQAE